MFRIIKLPVMMAVFLLILSGCMKSNVSPVDEANQAFADVQVEMQSVITDPKRAKEAIELLLAMKQSFADSLAKTQANRKQFIKLNADYNSTRAELDAAIAKVRKDMRSDQETITKYNRQMVDILTAEEWAEIQKSSSKAMSAAIQALQAR